MSGNFTRGVRKDEWDTLRDGSGRRVSVDGTGGTGGLAEREAEARANRDLLLVALHAAESLDRAGYDPLKVLEAVPEMVRDCMTIAHGSGDVVEHASRRLFFTCATLRTGTPAPPRPETAAREGGGTAPPPVLEQVREILDEESAWIARPNQKVEERIALAATIAAHQIVAATETMVEAENVTLRAQRDALAEALRGLSFAAQTSGGVAGRDEGLVEAIGKAEDALAAAGRR